MTTSGNGEPGTGNGEGRRRSRSRRRRARGTRCARRRSRRHDRFPIPCSRFPSRQSSRTPPDNASRPASRPRFSRQVKLIELRTRGLVNSLFSGEYRSVFKGQGMEFAEVREYLPGDEVRSIDWNVTARMRRPFVKRYIEERELTVMLAVDLSGSERFGTVRRFKSELATELGAVLAMSAVRNNDRVGVMLFTDRVEHVVPPAKGRRHVLRVIRDLLVHEPEGRGTDIRRRARVHARNAATEGDHLSRFRLLLASISSGRSSLPRSGTTSSP